MAKTKVHENQNLVDVAVNSYGSNWPKGLVAIAKENGLSLTDIPATGSELKTPGVDPSDVVLQALQRGKRTINTGLDLLTLDAPTNLVAEAVNPVQITLTWQDNSGGETGFEVWYKLQGDPFFVLFTTTAKDATTVDFTDLLPETGYVFKIRAKGLGFSDFTAEVVEATPGLAVPELAAVAVSIMQIDLSISAPGATVETDTQIQYRETGGEWADLLTVGIAEIAVEVEDLTHDTEYEFRARTVYGAHQGAWSEVASATTLYALEVITFHNPAVNGNWVPAFTYTGGGSIKWYFESGQVRTGLNPAATVANSGLDGTDQLVLVEIPSLSSITSLNFNSCRIKGVLDLTRLTGVTGTLQAESNTLLTSVLFPESGVKIGQIRLRGSGVTSVNLSNVTFGGAVIIDNCPNLSLISFPVANPHAISFLYLGNNNLAAVDISGLNLQGRLNLQNNPLTTLILPAAYTIVQELYIYNTDLEEIDLSGATLSGEVTMWLYSNSELTDLTLPTSTGIRHIIYAGGNPLLTEIDFTPLAGCINMDIRVNNSVFTELDVSMFASIFGLFLHGSTISTITYGSVVIGTYFWNFGTPSYKLYPLTTSIRATIIDNSLTQLSSADIDTLIDLLHAAPYNGNTFYIGNTSGGSPNANGVPSAGAIAKMTSLAASHNWTFTYWNGSNNIVIT